MNHASIEHFLFEHGVIFGNVTLVEKHIIKKHSSFNEK